MAKKLMSVMFENDYFYWRGGFTLYNNSGKPITVYGIGSEGPFHEDPTEWAKSLVKITIAPHSSPPFVFAAIKQETGNSHIDLVAGYAGQKGDPFKATI